MSFKAYYANLDTKLCVCILKFYIFKKMQNVLRKSVIFQNFLRLQRQKLSIFGTFGDENV